MLYLKRLSTWAVIAAFAAMFALVVYAVSNTFMNNDVTLVKSSPIEIARSVTGRPDVVVSKSGWACSPRTDSPQAVYTLDGREFVVDGMCSDDPQPRWLVDSVAWRQR